MSVRTRCRLFGVTAGRIAGMLRQPALVLLLVSGPACECCDPGSSAVRGGQAGTDTNVSVNQTVLTASERCWRRRRDQKLTKKERAELDYKKEVLRLAKEKQKHLADIEDKEVYRMPDSYEEAGAKRRNQQLDLLTARYQCGPT